MNQTYIYKNDQQLGPFDDASVLAMLGNGTFDYSDLCWREGWEDWKPLETIYPKPKPTPQIKESPAETPKKKRKTGCVTYFVAFFFIVILIGILSPKRKESLASSESVKALAPSPTPIANEKPVDTISASLLMARYQENEVLADKAYKGGKLIVTGTIYSIAKDIMGNPFVNFQVKNDKDFGVVQCIFSKSDDSQLADLSAGQNVAIEGVVSGKLMNVLLRKCKVVGK